jgi:hypothetical protein
MLLNHYSFKTFLLIEQFVSSPQKRIQLVKGSRSLFSSDSDQIETNISLKSKSEISHLCKSDTGM